ncbi:MAG: anthranilate synthase component I [Caldilineae bacterium]|nr:MAG: anthranilate synthase component I [Caldilineae bacterium]
MYHPSLDEVRTLAPQGNLIPVYRVLPADLETPVSVYLKLRQPNRSSFLLESVEKGEQLGRYSFIGVDPPLSLTLRGHEVTLAGVGGTVLEAYTHEDPLAALSELLHRRTPISLPDLPSFTGGAVGYWGYDIVRHFERLPETAVDELQLPDAVFLLADNLVIFDHVKHRLILLANARLDGDLTSAYAEAVARIEKVAAQLARPLQPPPLPDVHSDDPWISNKGQAEYEAMVRKAKEYIAAGDIFQVVLSQRLSRRTRADPFAIYRALRMTNPSPYMFFLDLPGELRLIGASPEMHVRLEHGVAQIHPIAGTRWRGDTPEEDARLAEELLADPKERAEHIMLVDLGRNDLGRVCKYGTVSVPVMMAVERFSHVMHIVSDVTGQLNDDMDAFSLLRATFPAGTVSGAPKVRAMEIIEELEGSRRGPYAGAVGYIGYDGAMDTCIAIRTIVMQGDVCHVQAGAGIVADSDPTYEYNETHNKARALAVAVERAEKGLL